MAKTARVLATPLDTMIRYFSLRVADKLDQMARCGAVDTDSMTGRELVTMAIKLTAKELPLSNKEDFENLKNFV